MKVTIIIIIEYDKLNTLLHIRIPIFTIFNKSTFCRYGHANQEYIPGEFIGDKIMNNNNVK